MNLVLEAQMSCDPWIHVIPIQYLLAMAKDGRELVGRCLGDHVSAQSF